MSEKMKYYSLDRILKKETTYNIIIGERSNGKTFAVQEYGIRQYVEKGEQMGLIRRWADDFTGKRGQETFSGIVNAGLISKITKGKWDRIKYQASRWYLAKYDKELDKLICDVEPFCYGFALNTAEHDKSTNYSKITTILFDEFLTRKGYITNEFIEFMNVLSTIVRDRANIKIFMCGNTVNKFSPYFVEMGLTRVLNMQKGAIDEYKFGETGLKVAVEYCGNNKGKQSDKFFAFENPKLKMITKGEWEIALYPHLPLKYKERNVRHKFYIDFMDSLLQCNIIKINKDWFVYIHRKTTPIKNIEKQIVYSQKYDTSLYHYRRITKPSNEITRKIYYFFQTERIYYQDNEIGEIVRNYLQWSKNDKGIE